MNFWDSSALVTLLIKEEKTKEVLDLFEKSDAILIWTLSPVEVCSTIHRLIRMGHLATERAEKVFRHWDELKNKFQLIQNIELVKSRALRVLRNHPLKAADSLQLAAALIACLEHPEGHSFVCLDTKLAAAASKEGFEVLPVKADPM